MAGVVKILLGLLMLLIAARQWRGRPHDGEEPALPGWMAAIDKVTLVKAIALGFALSALNPKNLLMTASAGVLVAAAELSTGGVATVVAGTSVRSSAISWPGTGWPVRSGL